MLALQLIMTVFFGTTKRLSATIFMSTPNEPEILCRISHKCVHTIQWESYRLTSQVF